MLPIMTPSLKDVCSATIRVEDLPRLWRAAGSIGDPRVDCGRPGLDLLATRVESDAGHLDQMDLTVAGG